MKTRTLHIIFGALVLALALLGCNLPVGNDAISTATSPAVPEAGLTVTETANCPAISVLPSPSGLISAVTMAEATSAEDRTPVNPTTVYGPTATFHAVVSLIEAPANTVLRAVWYAGDTANVAQCNTQIDSFELTTGGPRNIDFSLTPKETWPPGTYRVEIFTNNVLDQVVYFSVK
jgi:hypothetical protein